MEETGNQAQASATDKSIVSGSIINVFGNVVGLLDALFLWLITFIYGEGNLGSYILATTYVVILVRLGLMGFDKGLKRFIPMSKVSGDPTAGYRSSLGTSARYVTLFTLLGAIGVFLCADLLVASSPEATESNVVEWLRVLVWIAPLEALTLFCVHALRGASRMWPFVFVRNFLSPLILLTVGVSGALLGFGPWVLLVAYGLSRGVSVLVSFYLLFRGFPELVAGDLVRSRRQGELIRFSIPLGISEFLIYFLVRADVVMIMFFYPNQPEYVAFYGIAAMFAGAIKKIRHGFDESFGPLLAEMLASGQVDEANRSYRNVSRWLLIIILLIAPAASMASPAILALFGDQFVKYWAVVPILMSARVIAAIFGPTQVVLLMAGKSKTELVNNIVGNCLNIGLNILLIPRFGVYGAACATSTSIILLYIARTIEIYRYAGVSQDYSNVVRVLGAATLSVVPGILILRSQSHLLWTIAAGASYVLVYPFALRVLGTGIGVRKLVEIIRGMPEGRESGPPERKK